VRAVKALRHFDHKYEFVRVKNATTFGVVEQVDAALRSWLNLVDDLINPISQVGVADPAGDATVRISLSVDAGGTGAEEGAGSAGRMVPVDRV